MSSGLSKSPYRAMLNKDSLDTSIAIEDEHVDAPISLGLTTRQARVYLALLMMGNSKAKAIVSLSLVSRQDVYLIISSLQEMGLVQRKVSAPTTFTATPISEAVEALLERKASELRRTRLKTKNLVEKFNHISLHAFTAAGTSYLGIVSESDRGKKYRFALENARHSIDVVTTWKRFKQANLLFEDLIGSALVQGVVIRVVTENPPHNSLPSLVTKVLIKNPNFKMRTIPSRPQAVMAIFDEAQVAIAFNDAASLTSGPHLWSNSSNVIALSQVYFSALWNKFEKNQ